MVNFRGIAALASGLFAGVMGGSRRETIDSWPTFDRRGKRTYTQTELQRKQERRWLAAKADSMRALHRWGHRKPTSLHQRIASLYATPNPPGTKLAKRAAKGKVGIR